MSPIWQKKNFFQDIIEIKRSKKQSLGVFKGNNGKNVTKTDRMEGDTIKR